MRGEPQQNAYDDGDDNSDNAYDDDDDNNNDVDDRSAQDRKAGQFCGEACYPGDQEPAGEGDKHPCALRGSLHQPQSPRVRWLQSAGAALSGSAGNKTPSL